MNPEKTLKRELRRAEIDEVVRFLKPRVGLIQPGLLLAQVEKKFGAVQKFTSGTNMLRCRGITGTCTAGGHRLISSWLRAAEKKLVKSTGSSA